MEMLGEMSIQLSSSAPQHGVDGRPAMQAEMVVWGEGPYQILRGDKWIRHSTSTACIFIILLLMSCWWLDSDFPAASRAGFLLCIQRRLKGRDLEPHLAVLKTILLRLELEVMKVLFARHSINIDQRKQFKGRTSVTVGR